MSSLRITLVAAAGLVLSCQGFTTPAGQIGGNTWARRGVSVGSTLSASTKKSLAEQAAEAKKEKPKFDPATLPPPTSDELKSETGADFMPLATALMTSDWKEADKITREMLIFIAGAGPRSRKFVYWTEVPKIPVVDFVTMENLWLKYSDGKFGYTVQAKFWKTAQKQAEEPEDFEVFCRKIGWNLVDDELERKRRWFGNDEFIYDLEEAPKGHLPLTSALRGTQLFKAICQHPAWDRPEYADKKK
mmetsp:Transcript_14824/g.34931  ORF Transcript_14824/g.34931 Transcript_14824/m.34931 type:complete len:246 (+) Transcript_14824:76-813(+)|eukprot:CAMPEP_0172582396 /NCGR_PEP_ID=MMETSP1068-20121228/1799_1 /TAXON_ID=35684 /ORGANISM="Pseudopedinella elastica, Strain CCMP716" /LENGTH=245 /DNA_ID=CAMNT_0013375729 /DNA_START=55 /DNA_END=792 /DNA_ORIENTATION=+